MHIVVAMLALVGGAAFWWWRIKMVGEAASEVHDLAGRALGKYKRKKFLGKVNDAPLAVVDDPATAAVVLMFSLANEHGVPPPAVEAAIQSEVEKTMAVADPVELVTFGKWTASHATDANSIILRYGDIWRQKLNSREREQLHDMVSRVARVISGGDLSMAQKSSMTRLRQRIGLPPMD